MDPDGGTDCNFCTGGSGFFSGFIALLALLGAAALLIEYSAAWMALAVLFLVIFAIVFVVLAIGERIFRGF